MCIVNMWSDMMKRDMDAMKNYKHAKQFKREWSEQENDDTQREVQHDPSHPDILC